MYKLDEGSNLCVFRCSDTPCKEHLLKADSSVAEERYLVFYLSWGVPGFTRFFVYCRVEVSLKHCNKPYILESFNFINMILFLIFIRLIIISKLLNTLKKIHPVGNEQCPQSICLLQPLLKYGLSDSTLDSAFLLLSKLLPNLKSVTNHSLYAKMAQKVNCRYWNTSRLLRCLGKLHYYLCILFNKEVSRHINLLIEVLTKCGEWVCGDVIFAHINAAWIGMCAWYLFSDYLCVYMYHLYTAQRLSESQV